MSQIQKACDSRNISHVREVVARIDITTLAKAQANERAPKFIAFATDALEFPGCPRNYEIDFGYEIMPETSDAVPADMAYEFYVFWMHDAGEIAFRYNLLLYHFLSECGKAPVLPISLQETRERVRVNEEAWSQLTLESKLIIQKLVNENVERESQIIK